MREVNEHHLGINTKENIIINPGIHNWSLLYRLEVSEQKKTS